jgi:hypothetical protein
LQENYTNDQLRELIVRKKWDEVDNARFTMLQIEQISDGALRKRIINLLPKETIAAIYRSAIASIVMLS